MPLRCVDASVVVAWLVPGQSSPSVEEVWLAYTRGDDQLVAPPHLYAETISAIRRLAFRGLLPEEHALEVVAHFLRVGLPTHAPPGLYLRAYQLAARYHHSRAYDACYLAVAESLSCDLLTLDRRLYNAVAGDFPWVKLVGG